ncbi:MAG: DUF4197 domain-containing protein [Fibromonadaceae bacterium]|jgi:hypothetical protein|nr:DUF4197 domain-containing protein [Fibromonadaceae bacterium]
MRKFLIACSFSAVAAFGLFSCGNHLFDQFLDSEGRMVEALQEALVLGSKTAASNLGDASCTANLQDAMKCTTGYLGNKLVEIAVPDTVKTVLGKINSFTNAISALPSPAQSLLSSALGMPSNALSGLGKYGDSIKIALNRGAEKAAPNSINVFKDAIFGMSFSDARETLFGDSVAATTYLHKTTYNGLQSAFAPIIREPLNLLNPNKFWKPLVQDYKSFASKYSSIKSGINSNLLLSSALGNSSLPSLPYTDLPDDISTYLAEYATGKALDGLFFMVGKQETQLRADPWGTVKALSDYVTDGVGELLSDIFGKAKDGSL